jgi:CheY-like chemotaxis protein
MSNLAQPASVLVIDDYLLMRKNLQSILTLAGYQVYATSNVTDAIHVLHTAEINLILSDLMLPGMNSLTFYQQVKSRERWQQIPFIFVSGNIGKLEEMQPQLTADGTVCLPKPFAVQGLLDTVAQALSPVCTG